MVIPSATIQFCVPNSFFVLQALDATGLLASGPVLEAGGHGFLLDCS